ncbi:unnamed protein product [Ambrosiozyma monospora]|uniref:Unnamed protein product n=1 Tax=Ambrosiozyma monospora TaxID=43982 RepID=A0A9W6Z4M3_AMBMO|nr:unnamed protein product [Ambrosiozyma monospora]
MLGVSCAVVQFYSNNIEPPQVLDKLERLQDNEMFKNYKFQIELKDAGNEVDDNDSDNGVNAHELNSQRIIVIRTSKKTKAITRAEIEIVSMAKLNDFDEINERIYQSTRSYTILRHVDHDEMTFPDNCFLNKLKQLPVISKSESLPSSTTISSSSSSSTSTSS